MKKSLSISIPQPCSEDWRNFTPVPGGGFCSSCSKVVVDFTRMGDDEILDFFSNKPAHACGRFRSDQLKAYQQGRAPLRINRSMTLLKASFLSLLFVLVGRQASAQNTIGKTRTEVVQYPQQEEARTAANSEHSVKGVVRSKEDNEFLPGINILLKGTNEGTTTNADGQFEFPRKLKEGDVLVLSFIGLETQEYVVPKVQQASLIEVQMICSLVSLTGEVAVDQVYTEKQSIFYRIFGFLR